MSNLPSDWEVKLAPYLEDNGGLVGNHSAEIIALLRTFHQVRDASLNELML
jgi:hypothetical protein